LAFTRLFPDKAKPKKVIEAEVRKLDSLHAAAVLSGDLQEMDTYGTTDFMVTNPFNEATLLKPLRRLTGAIPISG
jgi:hypothetical protein